MASEAHPAQPGARCTIPWTPQRLPGVPGQAPHHPDALLELDSPRPQGTNAAHLQIQPFPVSFTRASAGQLSSSPRLLQARHGLPADLRPLRAEKTFLAEWPPPLPTQRPCPPRPALLHCPGHGRLTPTRPGSPSSVR